LKAILSLALALVVCFRSAAATADFDTWSNQFAAEWVRLSPQQATMTQYFAGAEQEAVNQKLTLISDWRDLYSQHAANQQAELARRGLVELARWPLASLTPMQRVSAAVLKWNLEHAVALAPFTRHVFVFSHFYGLQQHVVDFMSETHPLRRAADFENYLTRLEQISDRLDEGIAEARATAESGLLPPRYVLEKTQEQLRNFLAPPPAENVLVTALSRRGLDVTDFSAADRARVIGKAMALVTDRVRPAFVRVQTCMEELLPRAPLEGGLSRMPNGAAAYARILAFHTGTSLSADEIHALGLREVARIDGEQDALLRKFGFREGTLTERSSAARARPAWPDTPDPRAALLADYTRILSDAGRRVETLFNVRPRAPIEVRRVPPMSEKTASASYTPPTVDGSKPGIFWLPLPGPRFTAASRTLAYHEGVPGHHFHLALQQELASLPRYRRESIFGGGNAAIEGWAVYAEWLAMEQGWYEGDLPGHLNALATLRFRARRLVLDTGLHAKGWTRQQGIDYGIGVDRYMSNPGQGCSYMIGMLRILELRERAKAALGARFTLPAFHDVVLNIGAVPPAVLEQIVDEWIANLSKE
jgi:uncharacterized protein (DUF885 family)